MIAWEENPALLSTSILQNQGWNINYLQVKNSLLPIFTYVLSKIKYKSRYLDIF